jgi:hypothetical protein
MTAFKVDVNSTPPEVVLDRFVRTNLQKKSGFSGYLGKLDLDRVEPPSLREFLDHIQKTISEELRAEGIKASGGVEHPPFHFDYIDVSDGVPPNAYAFQHDGYAFIVITRTMMESMGDLSLRLAKSTSVVNLLGLDSNTVDTDELQELLFHILLHFLISHEYTHHIHQHADTNPNAAGLWTEFQFDATNGGINTQAQELDADGYAAFLVVQHILRGGGRAAALIQIGQEKLSVTEGDELLLNLFFLAAIGFFCKFWRGVIDMNLIRQLTHPLPPVRITYLIRSAKMWCDQNESVPDAWFEDKRFQELFRTVSEAIDEESRKTWDSDMSFFKRVEGTTYDQELLQAFDELRRELAEVTF